jgi:hypothetical protein
MAFSAPGMISRGWYLEKWLMTACFLPAAGEALSAGASLDSSTRRPPRENQDRRQDRPDDRHDRR